VTAPGSTEDVFRRGLAYQEDSDLLGQVATAVMSADSAYRYLLTRRWGDGPDATFIMLNPSTADAFTTDPTCTRVIRFARREGAGGVTVVNLFGYRATDPAALRGQPDPVGPLNDVFIRGACPPGRLVIAAWGAHGTLTGRAAAVTGMLTAAGVPLQCLGITGQGQPRHPLYVPAAAPLQPYQP
jgi:hypothetical protein